MQIATAANPLSSLPCRHPTSPRVPQPLAVRTCLFLWAVQDQACGDQAGLTPTLRLYSMHVKHNAAPASHQTLCILNKKKKDSLTPPVPPDPGATQGLEAGVKLELLGVALEMEAA